MDAASPAEEQDPLEAWVDVDVALMEQLNMGDEGGRTGFGHTGHQQQAAGTGVADDCCDSDRMNYIGGCWCCSWWSFACDGCCWIEHLGII